MRILLLTPRVPWPQTDGGRIAMARLAESLARAGAAVEVLSLNPRKHRVGHPVAPMPIEAVDIDTSRVLAPAVASIASRTPAIVQRFVSTDMLAALSVALQRFKPDVVQIESPFLLQYVAQIRRESRARIVLRSLNVEFRIWELLARNERNLLRKIALDRVASSLRAYEIRTAAQLDAIVPISRADLEDFRALGVRTPMHVAPCAVESGESAAADVEPRTAGFIGSLDFRPNQEAVQWILDELWPRVLAEVPDARLAIAGSAPPPWLLSRALPPGVQMIGFVDDAHAFLQSKAVILAPLFSGGGMRIKVLEAMALARPVVATRLGAGGIDVTNGHDIVLAEDAPSFARAVIGLFLDPERAMRIGREARATVAQRYDGDRIAREVLDFYASL